MTTLGSYYNSPADEESRQHYATVRIQEFQRTAASFSFETLLHAFRYYGDCYDQGFRLRHLEESAA